MATSARGLIFVTKLQWSQVEVSVVHSA